MVVASRTVSDQGRPLRTHSFDSGAAWENLALQASALGLVAHGMSGFDYERARSELGIPADHSVEAMVALGRPPAGRRLRLRRPLAAGLRSTLAATCRAC